jgi:hypothetical protein
MISIHRELGTSAGAEALRREGRAAARSASSATDTADFATQLAGELQSRKEGQANQRPALDQVVRPAIGRAASTRAAVAEATVATASAPASATTVSGASDTTDTTDPGAGDGTVIHGVSQGTWEVSDPTNPWGATMWPDYWKTDPSGTPWEEFGFQDVHAPTTERTFGYYRMPDADPSSAPPGSLGAFDPETGLYDWVRSGSGVTMQTPGPGNKGPVGSAGIVDGQKVVTDARGRTPDQSEALLALEAHNPNLAREVQSSVEYWNPEFRWTPGMSDEEIVAGLTQPYTGTQGATPGTMYLPSGGYSSNSADYSPWYPVTGGSEDV